MFLAHWNGSVVSLKNRSIEAKQAITSDFDFLTCVPEADRVREETSGHPVDSTVTAIQTWQGCTQAVVPTASSVLV